MPNRDHHLGQSKAINFFLTPLALILLAAAFLDKNIAFAAMGIGIISGEIAGILWHPDMDTWMEPDRGMRRQHWLYWKDFVYLPHRHIVTHSWPLGTAKRWRHGFLPVLPMALIMFNVWVPLWAIFSFVAMSAHDITHLRDDALEYRIGVWRKPKTKWERK